MVCVVNSWNYGVCCEQLESFMLLVYRVML